ncbi:MAG: alpha/beta hydrolase family protein [Candidatus Hydrogenedentota bacterium]
MKMQFKIRVMTFGLVWATCILAMAKPQPVQTIEFDAPSVDRTMKYNIVLPEGYKKSKVNYPVLYLLHGLTSNYTHWALMGVPKYAARYDMIIVMPDVGNSWYINWAESDEGQKNAWEDYMISDVIGHVDKNYRTINKREGRAINGLSMGGYGAFVLGLRHPEMFCSVGSHSGALSYVSRHRERIESGATGPTPRRRPLSEKPAKSIGIENFSSQLERTPKGTAFVTVEQCDAYDPFKLVLQIPKEELPHLHIDCGTEDGLIRSARAMQTLLIENTIPFTYAESSGGHKPAYWTREVAHSMAVQYNVIQRNLATLESR